MIFIVYPVALYSIITDLFRDPKLNGWWKVLWHVTLVFIPLFTSLLYLMASGSGMAKRSSEH